MIVQTLSPIEYIGVSENYYGHSMYMSITLD